ncbi:Coiled-coil domain-containing protein 174 [Mus musculus] [Rhizoctonia solani]|uniref:Coiled-coil domain-containing protein 174 [Mus musculus] n=1 Tax=Rhizoctonia solani TaxID=456999 RepID=A0A0K6G4G0_9AGAM|nr:Coiled-coil domain-containing protein 174 [Mus musculus] [Rhizoctonia solani]
MSKKQSVNAASFFDLKAELAKHEDAFAKSKLSGKGKAEPVVGGSKPDKKKPTWARENKGVRDRARRDAELDQISKPTLESARAKLERKAKLYDQLQKGKGAGLSEKQRESLLIDFDGRDSGNDTDSSGDRDRDESLVVPGRNEDDPIIEYEDEFGRIRTARKSEVPRDRLPENTNPFARSENQVPADDDLDVVYGRATHFPVYEPSNERRAAIEASLIEEPLVDRYDASKDNRAAGAAFYQFSKDEETRRKEMEELKQARVDTQIARAEADADAELVHTELGDSAPQDYNPTKMTSRAVEKRRQELEARRQMLNAKRRKMLGPGATVEASGAEDFLASLEKELRSTSATTT